MTIEQKAKAYDEALELAKDYFKANQRLGELEENDMLSDIFPELKESEDERIRKDIIRYIKKTSPAMGENIEHMVAWLEKQEQKPTDEDIKEALRTEYEKGRADAIAEIQKPVDCIDCTNSKGCINCKDGNMKETLVRKPAWSEEDEVKINRIVACLENLNVADNDILLRDVEWLKSLKDRVQPKQEWSEEDIRNIEDIDSVLFYDKDLPEDTCVRLRNWLKSLRPQPKKEWSEEDERIFEKILQQFTTANNDCKLHNASFTYDKEISFLKSLRHQNKYDYNPYKAVVESIAEMCKHYDKASHSGLRDFYDNVKVKCKDAKEYDNMYSHNTWKPSEEQMRALHDLNLTGNISYAGQGQVLIELYNDLKKLAEE